VIEDAYTPFLREFERWISLAKYRNDLDVTPLAKEAGRYLQTRPPLPHVAPCLGAIYFAVIEFEFDFSWWQRLAVRAGVWLLRAWVFRGRPMWNDFWMCLWQLSRDPRYIGRLHSHLKHANPIQLETGVWMVTSVCQQDPEFNEHWHDVIRERGEVFA